MELSEAKEILKDMKKSMEQSKKDITIDSILKALEDSVKAIDTILKVLDNSISKDELQKTFTKHTEEYHKYLDGMERKLSHLKDDHKIRATYAEFGVLKGKVEVLQELLGE